MMNTKTNVSVHDFAVITRMPKRGWKQKMKLVKAMDDFIRNHIDDEFLINHWLTLGCPDCSDESDYEYIAQDTDGFKEVEEVFYDIAEEEGYHK